MNAREINRNTVGFGLSAAIVSVFNGLLVLVKETNPDTVLAWMKSATGHHWATHGVLDVLLFLALGFALSRVNGGKGPDISAAALVKIITAGVVVGYLIIAIFNLVGAD